MSELSILELEAQHGEVLPEREALSRFVTVGSFNGGNHIHANNLANAIATRGGDASARATQIISVS
jgi:hypothetical protein